MSENPVDIDFDPRPEKLRELWSSAKGKLGAAIAAKKIKLPQDELGPLIDRRVGQWKPLERTKEAALHTQRQSRWGEAPQAAATHGSGAIANDLRALRVTALEIEKIAADYKFKLRVLKEPAQTELTQVLDAIIARVKVDVAMADRHLSNL